MYELGWTQSRYTPDAGTVHGDVHCGVCGAVMKCDAKGSTGPRSFVEAMGNHVGGVPRSHKPHDIYSCRHQDDPWHHQVVALREAAEKTPSGRLRAMYIEEAEEILKSGCATIVVSKYNFG